MKKILKFYLFSLTIIAIALACFLPFQFAQSTFLYIDNSIKDFYPYSSITTNISSSNGCDNLDISPLMFSNATTYASWGAVDIGVDTYATYLDNIEEEKKNTTYVAVLDTGIDTDHPQLNGRVDYTYARKYSYNSSTQQTTTQDGKSHVEDMQGHGTHVSGIIADLTPENVKIIPIKVIEDNNTGNLLSTVLALEYLAELKNTYGINICAANLSIGSTGTIAVGSSFHNAFSEAIQTARAQNISIIVAAGNSSDDCTNYCPANIADAITVSNITKEHTKSPSSCYGSYIDLAAPGQQIYSTANNGSFKYLSGTSMAAPHVSACVALLNVYNYTENYTVTNVENLLLNNATDLGDTNWDGKGLVSLKNLANYSVVKPSTHSIHLNIDEAVQLVTSSDIENITDGSTVEFKVFIKKGYKINQVLVNGNKQTISSNILIVENIQTDTIISISTTEDTDNSLDTNFIISISLIGVGAIVLVVLGFVITKRHRPY